VPGEKQIISGLIALVVLWIVVDYIWVKREKPIPVQTETADSARTILQTFRHGKYHLIEVKIFALCGEITEIARRERYASEKGDLLLKITLIPTRRFSNNRRAASQRQLKRISSAPKFVLMIKRSRPQRSEDFFNKKLISDMNTRRSALLTLPKHLKVLSTNRTRRASSAMQRAHSPRPRFIHRCMNNRHFETANSG